MNPSDYEIEKLREDLSADSFGMAVGLGFPGMFLQNEEIHRASPEELLKIAERNGFDLRMYRKYN